MAPIARSLRPLLTAVASLSTATLLSCGGAGGKDLAVISYSPSAPMGPADDIEINFDHPVVPASEVGRAVEPSSVQVSPAFEFTATWTSTTTLTVKPKAALRGATKYKVTLAGELGTRTGGFAFEVLHRPLQVEGLVGIDTNAIDPAGPWPVSFNQAVNASAVAEHCGLKANGERIALVPTSPDASGAQVSVKPARALRPGASVTLACDGLVAADGNHPLTVPYALDLTARPQLAVVEVTPTGRDVSADDAVIELEFSTSVELAEVKRRLRAEPAITGLDGGWMVDDGRRYRVSVDLTSNTDYTLTLDGLQDVHGQALPAPHVASFRAGSARPRVNMETGTYTVEASSGGYPIWSRNVGGLTLECAAVEPARLSGVLGADLQMSPWYWDDAPAKPIPWKQLGLSPKKTTLPVGANANKWHLERIDFGKACANQAGAHGVYLAEVTVPGLVRDADRPWTTPTFQRVLANVTDLGAVMKTGRTSGLIWVTHLANGTTVEGAKVMVRDLKGKVVAQGTTDRDGLFRIGKDAMRKVSRPAEGEEGEWGGARTRLIATIERGADRAVLDGNWNDGLEAWNFGVNEDWSTAPTVLRGFIQSDRGLYRPGETVHFKGLLRESSLGRAPRVPEVGKVAVEITDARGQQVLTTDAVVSKFGGFWFDTTLPPEATLGDYYVTVTANGQTFRERFMVEEFRAAAFEVKMQGADRAGPEDRLEVVADARFLFGAPVANAKVEWVVRARQVWLRFADFDGFSFEDDAEMWWSREQDSYGDFVADGSGTTNAQGRIAIPVRDTNPRKAAADYVITANITDDANQTLSGNKVVRVHPVDRYLGVTSGDYFQEAGKPIAARVVAVTTDGKPTASKATVRLVRQEYRCTWKDVGPRSSYECEDLSTEISRKDLSVGATGASTISLTASQPGRYAIEVTGVDGRGTALKASTPLWITGQGEAWWRDDGEARMTLVANKPRYQPGETAKLIAQANLTSPLALITIERDGVLDAQVRKLATSGQALELPIQASWAPNVYASVTLMTGRRGPTDKDRPKLKLGLIELGVDATARQLAVEVKLEQAEVRPGALVRGTLHVTHDGKPVSAEVALSAADEGVLSLIAYKTPNPMDTFFQPFGLSVGNASNLLRLARLNDPTKGDPDEGGDFGSSNQGKIRSRFVSSAYWVPNLVTDARGRASFEFTAPDNLSAFRVMAVAADLGDRFGAGDARVTINKPLMARPALPRFLGAGDRSTVGVVIHNYTDRAGTATVRAQATGATLDRGDQSIAVPAAGSATVSFGAVAAEAATATFEFAVAMNGEQDRVRVTLPTVKPRLIATRTIGTGRLETARWNGRLAVPSAVLRGESQLMISVDRTGMGDLEPSLRYLVEYPYGCLEQTLSRFIPLAKAKDLSTSLGLASLRATKMDDFIKAGVTKVARHQTVDGMFSLWPNGDAYPHLTAYALWGLGEAKRAGIAVPADTMNRGAVALREWASKQAVTKSGESATLAMAAFVLADAGIPDAPLQAKLYDARADLPRYGQAFLLRALHRAKAPAAQLDDLKARMLAGLVIGAESAEVKETAADDDYYMNSNVRATAMVLAALLEVEPTHAVVPKLATGLRNQRGAGGSWQSTQDNLWALVALSDYARRVGKGQSQVEVLVGGTSLGVQTLRDAQVWATQLSLEGVRGDEVIVRGDVGTHFSVRAVESSKDLGAATSQGFHLTRTVYDEAGKIVTQAKAGDRLTVKLAITTPEDRNWVAVVDRLPAGFEVINPRLAAQQDGAGDGDERYDWRVDWTHVEARDEQVQWFADRMGRGTHEVSYSVHATTTGTFTALPAHVEAMYEPSVTGRTAASTFTVNR